jgi:hypothetical protein
LESAADIQPVGTGLPFPFQNHLDSIPQGKIPPLGIHHPQPSASTLAYVSPPSAVSDRIEHPASPPLPTGMTPFTNPESTLPAQLKLDAFISRDLAMKTISLFFEHVSQVLKRADEDADAAGIMYHAPDTQTVFHGRSRSRGRRAESNLLRIDTTDDIDDSYSCMSLNL